MKVVRCIMKITAVVLAAAAAICCVIAYWDKILSGLRAIGDKLGIEIEVHKDSEFDDYADWED